MAAATSAQIKTQLAHCLKIAEASLPSYWDQHVATAATFARQEVRGRLLERGFEAADVDAWDRLYEFTLDLGVWKSLMLGGEYASFDPAALDALDRRGELAGVTVFVNDEFITTAPSAPGTTVTSGPRVADEGGVFDWHVDPDDPHHGIQW